MNIISYIICNKINFKNRKEIKKCLKSVKKAKNVCFLIKNGEFFKKNYCKKRKYVLL